MVGIELGDGEAGQPSPRAETARQAIASSRSGLCGAADFPDRQVEEVHHIAVDVEHEPVGRRAHPRQRLLGCLFGALRIRAARQPGKGWLRKHLEAADTDLLRK